METKREALGDDAAALELAQDVASMPHAPNGDPQDEPEEEEHDDEQEPDGRWVYAHGCWLYE